VAPKLKPEILEQRKLQILEAALTCFARKGYHQTTIDEIVEEAGLSKGGLYWHFSSKKELFLEIFEYMTADTEALLSDAVPAGGSAKEALIAVLHSFIALVTDDDLQELMWLLMDVWTQNRQDPEVNEVAIAMYRRFRQPLVQIIEQGVATGEFRPVDAGALAGIIIAIFDGLMVQWTIDGQTVDWDRATSTLLDTLVAGLLRGDGADTPRSGRQVSAE
jgi:AcrR family transcriptional regulator